MDKSHVISKLINATDNSAYGAKAVNLQKLISMDLNVPTGICIHTVLSDIRNNDNEKYKCILNYIQSNIEVLVPSKYGWAVRSSATIEDAADKSYAGQFLTVIVNNKSEIKNAIEYILDNNYINYKTNPQYKMGIIIQKFIEPEWAGVGFSCNPITGDKTPVIELCEGRGESLVNGKVTPWKYIQRLGWQTTKPEKFEQTNIESIAYGLKNVSDVFGYEVDMEWAIKDNIVYWLQARPVTAISSSNNFFISSIDKKKLSGRWTLLDQCYKPMTPIIESLDPNGFFNSINWDTHLINHFPYFKMKSSNILQYQKEYEIGEILNEWEKIKEKYEKDFDEALVTEMDKIRDYELYEELKRRISRNREFTNYYMDRSWMFTRMKTGQRIREYLRRFYSNAMDIENELAMLSSGLNTITAEKSRKITQLVKLGLENPNLLPDKLEELDGYTNEWVIKFKQFIDEFGYLTPCSSYFHFPTIKENPEVMFYALYNMITGKCSFNNKDNDSTLWMSRAQWVKSKITDEEWVDFNKNLTIFRECLIRTENDDYLLHKGAAQIRLVLLEIGKRLRKRCYIKKREDVFFLNNNEIESLLMNNDNKVEFEDIINYRKNEFEKAEKLYPPMQILDGDPIFNHKNINDSHILTGMPASNGFAEGIAFVIKNPLDLNVYSYIPNNAIIISNVLVPGITQNIVGAGAIVTEIGGFLSHGAIWAREMKIPAVVGVEGALSKITTGDKIIVDAVCGEIRIVS